MPLLKGAVPLLKGAVPLLKQHCRISVHQLSDRNVFGTFREHAVIHTRFNTLNEDVVLLLLVFLLPSSG